MVLLESKKIGPGWEMPSFRLVDAFGKEWSDKDVTGEKGTLIVFTCNHCPYAIAVWDRVIQIAVWGEERGITTAAINPNIHPDYPEDRPEKMRKLVQEKGFSFPYLVDETQATARAFSAVCTPDIYLFDSERKLYYHGRIDDNWKEPGKVTRQELREAIESMLQGNPPSAHQNPSMGCSIKWREE